MRRFTMITIIILFLLLAVAAFFQVRAANGPPPLPRAGRIVHPNGDRHHPLIFG